MIGIFLPFHFIPFCSSDFSVFLLLFCFSQLLSRFLFDFIKSSQPWTHHQCDGKKNETSIANNMHHACYDAKFIGKNIAKYRWINRHWDDKQTFIYNEGKLKIIFQEDTFFPISMTKMMFTWNNRIWQQVFSYKFH